MGILTVGEWRRWAMEETEGGYSSSMGQRLGEGEGKLRVGRGVARGDGFLMAIL
jgi:hypothetical protein